MNERIIELNDSENEECEQKKKDKMKRIITLLVVLGCTIGFGITQEEASAAKENPLANTEWRLVEFQSMDESIGMVRSHDPSLYTMRLNGDGTVNMRLNCNRASGTWPVEPSSDGTSGHFKFGPLAATRALCPPPSMDEQVAAHVQYIASYLLKDGNLYLSLMADGGIYAGSRSQRCRSKQRPTRTSKQPSWTYRPTTPVRSWRSEAETTLATYTAGSTSTVTEKKRCSYTFSARSSAAPAAAISCFSQMGRTGIPWSIISLSVVRLSSSLPRGPRVGTTLYVWNLAAERRLPMSGTPSTASTMSSSSACLQTQLQKARSISPGTSPSRTVFRWNRTSEPVDFW
jgi:heat shock protein HslJ